MMVAPTTDQKTVLVTGANGYIGQAVASAFQRAGYATYGLIRSTRSTAQLQNLSIVPIIGSAADAEAAQAAVNAHTTALNVIVSTTEELSNYAPHFFDTLSLLRLLAKASADAGVRPLVLFTSGCKDYGRTGLDGSSGLQAQTEECPLRPPPLLADRARYAIEVLRETLFDAAVLRPTHVHGYSSSYLGKFFEMAADAKKNEKTLVLRSDPRTILHSLHVDDCGEAYVALANHSKREQVIGQCFNISAGNSYETTGQIGEALTMLYSIYQGVEFDAPDGDSLDAEDPLTSFSQLVGSEEIRSLTGWKERRPMFVAGLDRYRQEYESAVQGQDENVGRIQGRDLIQLASGKRGI